MTWEGLTPPYRTIVADPPWMYDEGTPDWGKSQGTHPLPYSMMSVEEISDLPVVDLAAPGSILFLWTTNRYLWDARDIAYGWGFEPSNVIVWCKEPIGQGPGGVFATTTEYVVLARRTIKAKRQVERAGALIRAAREAAGINRSELHRMVRGGTPTGIVFRWEDDDCVPNPKDWAGLQAALPNLAGIECPYVEPAPKREPMLVDRNWFVWPRGVHSQKPAAFLDLVEQVSPGPYVELFARSPRLGWDSWGYGWEQAS